MEGKGQWVHMDKVEYDKLQWMKDLPPPSADDAKVGKHQGHLLVEMGF